MTEAESTGKYSQLKNDDIDMTDGTLVVLFCYYRVISE